jgi:hypothetical protein
MVNLPMEMVYMVGIVSYKWTTSRKMSSPSMHAKNHSLSCNVFHEYQRLIKV